MFIADVNKEMFNVYLRYLNKSKQQSKNSVFGLEFWKTKEIFLPKNRETSLKSKNLKFFKCSKISKLIGGKDKKWY